MLTQLPDFFVAELDSDIVESNEQNGLRERRRLGIEDLREHIGLKPDLL